MTVQIFLASPAPRAEIEIFTLAFRKVNEITLSNVQAGLTDLGLPLTDKEGNPLANGLYYVVVTTKSGRYTGKLLVLR